MTNCNHKHLILLPGEKERLKCQHCHLTLTADELSDGYCPECWETQGKKRNDFDIITAKAPAKARYRCEDCGAIIGDEI